MISFDIHKNKASVYTAINSLDDYIKRNKKLKIRLFSVIVGHGSTGGSHKIKTAALIFLEEAKVKNKIRGYILGSDIDIFNNKYINFNSKLKKDITREMHQKHNPGEIYIWV